MHRPQELEVSSAPLPTPNFFPSPHRKFGSGKAKAPLVCTDSSSSSPGYQALAHTPLATLVGNREAWRQVSSPDCPSVVQPLPPVPDSGKVTTKPVQHTVPQKSFAEDPSSL